MPYNAMIDTYDIQAALVAELQTIRDYDQPQEIAQAQAKVIRRLAMRFQISLHDLMDEMNRNELGAG